MILDYLKYTRRNEKSNEWIVEGKDGDFIKFENINLIVGKNAAGKSRLLETIRTIANLLALKLSIKNVKFLQVGYDIIFRENTDKYSYSLKIENEKIVEESLSINGVEKYNRVKKIIYSEEKHIFLELLLDDKSVITTLKDNSEYPYITEIFEWGNALKKYGFTNQYEKSNLLSENLELSHFDINSEASSENIVQLFAKGKELFGDLFINAVIKDFGKIDYDIQEVDLYKCASGIGISVQEEELNSPTSQLDMSQGMFRALSFLIQLNFALFSKKSVCLLVDDLGEGLDFSRSKLLINLLISKIENSDIQIFITSNDQYIMNKIPLKYWSIIERRAKSSLFYNYHNSKNIFEDFSYTGLNNFDFLATDFYMKGFEDESED